MGPDTAIKFALQSRAMTSPDHLVGIWKDMVLIAVVPTLTALLLSSLNDLKTFFILFLYALLEFSCAKHFG